MTASLPATRSAALHSGSTRYATGRPCLHGHIAPRNTSSAACIECVRQARLIEQQAYQLARGRPSTP